MKYLPPFDLLRRSVEIATVRGELRVSLSYDDFIKLIRMMISGVEVDEAGIGSNTKISGARSGTVRSPPPSSISWMTDISRADCHSLSMWMRPGIKVSIPMSPTVCAVGWWHPHKHILTKTAIARVACHLNSDKWALTHRVAIAKRLTGAAIVWPVSGTRMDHRPA